MLANDYFDWSQVSGLYVRNISHAERYATYGGMLSQPGLHVVVVAEFLHDADEIVNPVRWRSSSVYERGDELAGRLALTIASLQAIGAVRTAEAVRTAKSISPSDLTLESIDKGVKAGSKAFVQELEIALQAALGQMNSIADQCEDRQELERLLEAYAQDHREALAADLTRHGDPRREPGYSRAERIEELRQLQRRELQREAQRKSVEDIVSATKRLRKVLAEAAGDAKRLKRAESLRTEYFEMLRDAREFDPPDRSPELVESLAAAEQLMAEHMEFFRPPMTKNAKLNAQLAALGEFERWDDAGVTELSWESPEGFHGAWRAYRLSITFPSRATKVLANLVQLAEAIRARLPDLEGPWRRELIANFRDVHAMSSAPDELTSYFDVTGAICDDAILRGVEGCNIVLLYEDDELYAETDFAVEWDIEHRFNIVWEDELLRSIWADSVGRS
ncbi:MAG: hypothetical protein KDB14_23370 [Planctomycetales bacterium]|nr:hypothetical protein [Planctomycetales bacterium]